MNEKHRTGGISRRTLCKAALVAGAVTALPAPTAAEAAEATGAVSADAAPQGTGRWMRGEYHTHTILSKDATNPYMAVANNLAAAFRDTAAFDDIDNAHPDAHIEALAVDGTEFDYLFFQEHLRRSLNGVADDSGTGKWNTPYYLAIQKQYEFVRGLQQSGSYADKAIAFAAEWDMPDMDHGAVLFHTNGVDALPIEKIHEFEWKFAHANGAHAEDGDDPTAMYENNGATEQELWGDRRGNSGNVEDSYAGAQWLAENFPDGFLLINHPSRHNGSSSGVVTIEKLRRLNDIAPDLVFAIEGMPGNQMSWSGGRGELPQTFGGCDPMIAKTGGVWDAMLSEGRRFWNFCNADFHFKTSGTSYASGYWPSEYSCQHTYVIDTGNPVDDVVRALRSGNSYSTYGNLIDALEFTATNDGTSATMGETLEAVKNTTVTVSIRFHVPTSNNYQTIGGTNTGIEVSNAPELHHIDLIMGTVTGKVDESQYASTDNADAKIVKTFYAEDFGEPDVDGCYTVVYEIEATPDTTRYFRLRGTNVADVDDNGDPLQDVDPSAGKSGTERFDYINDYNYAHLAFYANPVYVTAVDDPKIPQLRDNLAQAIKNGEGHKAEDYSSASFAVLATALERGRNVLNNQNATRDELAAAAKDITDAVAALVKAPAEGDGSTTGGNSGSGNGGSGTGDGTGTGTASKDSGDATNTKGLPETGDQVLPAVLGLGVLGAIATAIGVKHVASADSDEA